MDTILSILNQSLREAIAPSTAAVVIAVIGLNIHFGFTGLLNMGQAGFMLIGAYGFAISIIEGLPLVVAIVVGLGGALLFALVLGIPTLKLRGDYLAIVTISAAEIVRFVGRLSALEDFTGGALGLRGSRYQGPFLDLSFLPDTSWTLSPFNYRDTFDGSGVVRGLAGLLFIGLVVAAVLLVRRFRGAPAATSGARWGRVGAVVGLSLLALLAIFFVFPITYQNNVAQGWWVRLVAWTLVGLCTLLAALLVRSPWGRLLRGIREDEDAIRSLGKNVFAIKMQALIIGGSFGALGGIVYVLPSTVQADSMGRALTFFAYTALLIGGAATIFGPVLGTVIFYGGRVLLRETANAYVPSSIMSDQQTETFSLIVVGVVLMLLVIFRPQGILGDKRELRINV
ncbi:branched-chain amino acid ABC transporter permease [Nocardioides sp. SYSU D00038]|uniref:branched-chain amino acid ABC transporter permease n=1 Tax=Nocardioides sp. SYSU D00038 TaxID=2812554 RepID=UPI001967EC74|nr:branched-chain amino acid ABC transporter permease [Nocardioides sp. SYSU D00038]